MELLFILTVWFVKLLTIILKVTGRGRGTALPGLLIEKYLHFLIPHILDKSPYTILITGTNGKTTTRTFLVNILQADGKVLQNRSGSNLLRGILSELITQTDFLGRSDFKYAVFEIEEASMPVISEYISPDQIIVTNLYRDQLDAYGEIDRTHKFIQTAISNSPNSVVILNGDDPLLMTLDTSKNKKTYYYQIDDKLKKQFVYEGEKPHYAQADSFKASNIKVATDLSTTFDFGNIAIKLNIPGYYHVYNALASILSAKELNIDLEVIKRSLESTAPAFGRGELINYQNKNLHIFLVKNRAGFNLNLDLLKFIDNINLVFVLNDNTADGKDVSWIWDSNIEIINSLKIKTISCSGTRSQDILLRTKYALPNLKQVSKNNYRDEKTGTDVVEIQNFNKLLEHLAKSENRDYYILTTYTAMLELRKLLTGNSLNV